MSKLREAVSGKESPSEILRLALTSFSKEHKNNPNLAIQVRSGIPYLVFRVEGAFECVYRLDIVAQELFIESERIYDEYAKEHHGLGDREKLVRGLAYNAISSTLAGLVCNQAAMMKETFNESLLLTSSILFKALAAASETHREACKNSVKGLLQESVKGSSKRKREYLTRLLKTSPALRLSVTGRPPGPSKGRVVYNKTELVRRVSEAIRQSHEYDGITSKARIAGILRLPEKSMVRDLGRYGLLTKEALLTKKRDWRTFVRDVLQE